MKQALVGMVIALSTLAAQPVHANTDGMGAGFMVVTGGVNNPDAVPDAEYARSYGPAVWALVESYGAHYLVRGRPLEIYEGSWQDWRAVVISKWAQRKTGAEFWYSDAYQNDVMPRRLNPGTAYVVGLFDKLEAGNSTGHWNDAPLGCDTPMLTFGEYWISNDEQFAHYAQAVSDSGLVAQYGGIPLLFGKATELLEGQWPDNYGVTVTQWPCREAFETLYYSNIYQSELKPLRDGAIDMNLILLKPGRPETSGQP